MPGKAWLARGGLGARGMCVMNAGEGMEGVGGCGGVAKRAVLLVLLLLLRPLLLRGLLVLRVLLFGEGSWEAVAWSCAQGMGGSA